MMAYDCCSVQWCFIMIYALLMLNTVVLYHDICIVDVQYSGLFKRKN